MLKKLSTLRPGSMFITLRNYTNEAGEIADYSIVFHISYENALRRSIDIASSYITDSDLSRLAQKEVVAGYQNALDKLQSSLELEDDPTYDRCFSDSGSPIKGVKVHKVSGIAYIFGLINSKRVIVPGVYKKVNHRPLTIEKDKIRKLCPAGKYRQFKLLSSQLDSVIVQGMELLP